MGLIGSLVLGFQVKGMDSVSGALKGVRSQLAGFSKSIGGIGNSLAGFAGISGVGAIGIALGAIKKYADVGSQLQDMSDRTGIAASKLSTLKFAAEQSGTSLDGLGTGLKSMQKFLADTSNGFQELRGFSPDEQFKAFADKIAAIQDPAERTAMAMKVFGKSGADLLPLLMEGGKGIDALQAKAEALGLGMSNADASAAEALGDSIDELKSRAEALGVSLGKALVPSLIQIATFAKDATDKFNSLRDAIIASKLEDVHQEEANSEAFMNRMEANARAKHGWVPTTEDPIEIAKNEKIKAMNDEINKTVSFQDDIAKLTEQFNLQSKTIGMTANEAAIYKLEMLGASHESLAALREQTAAIDEQAEAYKQFQKSIKDIEDFNAKLRDTAAAWREQSDAFGKTPRQAEIDRLRKDRASEDELRPLIRADAELTLKENRAKMQERADSIRESLVSPLEEYKQKIEEISRLEDAGLLGKRAADNARLKEFQGIAASLPEMKFAGAANRGSSEAISTLNRARFAPKDPAEIMAALQRQQIAKQEAANVLLKQIADAGDAGDAFPWN